jgi:hypothetical protein
VTAGSNGAGTLGRCDNQIPTAYADYAGRYLKSMQEYPLAYTSAEDVADAVYAAATDGRDKLRDPAGADSHRHEFRSLSRIQFV